MEVSEIKVSYNLPKGKRSKVHNSDELYQIILQHWDLNHIEMQEEMKLILFNINNQIIGIHHLSKGGINGTLADIRLIFSVTLKCLATSIAIVHNHPSGNLTPSDADYKLTNKIEKACSYFDIKLLDHLIISKEGYYSFSNEGKI